MGISPRSGFSGWPSKAASRTTFLWRKKARFDDDLGVPSVLQWRMEESVTEEELRYERHEVEPSLRTREEVAYYRTIGRFATA